MIAEKPDGSIDAVPDWLHAFPEFRALPYRGENNWLKRVRCGTKLGSSSQRGMSL